MFLICVLLLFSIFSFFRQVSISSPYNCLLTSDKERSHGSCHWCRKEKEAWSSGEMCSSSFFFLKTILTSREGLPFIVSLLCFFLFLFSFFSFLCNDFFSCPGFLKKITFIAYFISQLGTCFDRTMCFLPPGDSQRAWRKFVWSVMPWFPLLWLREAPIGKIYPRKQITLWFLIQNLSKLSP